MKKEKHCIYCGNVFEGSLCPNCGEENDGI